MSEYQNNSIFWVELHKIQPNPFQPRREFEPKALEDLADSIRQYGILQPLVVTRKEILREDDGGMDVQYELIAGERRLRASKIAGLNQVPVIIRKETDDKVKLELAIIENLQREDLNPIDRALAFEQLYKQFKITHAEIGKRMGKSRVYVSNTLRLLSLPEDIKQGLMASRITEGHTRPLLMLSDRPEEQRTLYKEIMVKKMSVRDAEKVARKIAQDKVRKKEFFVDPKIQKYEKQLSENLGTRVHIEAKENGGQITIDYFTLNDLEEILTSMRKVEREQSMMDSYLSGQVNNMEESSLHAEHEIQKSTPVSFSQEKNENEVLEKPVIRNGEPDIEIVEPQFTEQEVKVPEENYIRQERPEYVVSPEIENNEKATLDITHKEPSFYEEELSVPDTSNLKEQISFEEPVVENKIDSHEVQEEQYKSPEQNIPIDTIQNQETVNPVNNIVQNQESPIYQELKDAYREPIQTEDYNYSPPLEQQPYQQPSTQQNQQTYQQPVYQNQAQNQQYPETINYQQQPEPKRSFLGKIFG